MISFLEKGPAEILVIHSITRDARSIHFVVISVGNDYSTSRLAHPRRAAGSGQPALWSKRTGARQSKIRWVSHSLFEGIQCFDV
jgi:hypothetical protein